MSNGIEYSDRYVTITQDQRLIPRLLNRFLDQHPTITEKRFRLREFWWGFNAQLPNHAYEYTDGYRAKPEPPIDQRKCTKVTAGFATIEGMRRRIT